MKYDILIPAAFKDYSFLKRTVKYVEKNLCPEQIFIIRRLKYAFALRGLSKNRYYVTRVERRAA